MASRAVPRYIEELLDPYSGSTGGNGFHVIARIEPTNKSMKPMKDPLNKSINNKYQEYEVYEGPIDKEETYYGQNE